MKGVVTAVLVAMLALVACGDENAADEGDVSDQDLASSKAGRALSVSPREGVATFYDADGSGNCSYARSKNLDVVALAMPEYAKSAACGTCLLVKGPKGSVSVRVVDSCPGCAAKGVNLDLSASAFAKIADPAKGKIPITYSEVACDVPGKITYYFKSGSSKYWTAIQVLNHALPISKLEYEKNGSWVSMPRADYNFFIAAKGVGDQPDGLKLRVTATDDQTIEDTLPGAISGGKSVAGESQFE